MPNINIHNTDVLEYLKNYTGEKFHSVLADVPYGISFMGKSWDKYTPIEYQTWCSEWGKELLNHLYPGSVCMFFGGTRTYHRLATGLEDAGFEIFDSMMFLYGSGFPKATDISKGIDKKFNLEREIIGTENNFGITTIADGKVGYGDYAGVWDITKPNHPLAQKWNGYKTCLKPAFEPIVLCRKPRGKETFVDCALNYGSGSLNVDGSRIEYNGPIIETNRIAPKSDNTKMGLFKENGKLATPSELGRFPANLGLICDCECEPCECDYQTIGDSSRFFYTAKSSRKERNLGLDHLPDSYIATMGDGIGEREHNENEPSAYVKNNHPTVKPIKLIEYLATMLKPPVENSSILIPFSGSGSEIIGAMFAGWNVINAIEIDAGYCNIAENRISYWKQFSTYADGLKGNRG